MPHTTLHRIARNHALDPIFEEWQPILEVKLEALNAALRNAASEDLRRKLGTTLLAKKKEHGKRSITDAEERRWILPPNLPRRTQFTTVDKDFDGWYDWEVPFDTDPDWPKPLQEALTECRRAWRQKMDEVDECIAARPDQEELVDQPIVDRTRVRFPDSKVVAFTQLEAMADGSILHAEGTWGSDREERRVAVMVGPQYGPLIVPMVEVAAWFLDADYDGRCFCVNQAFFPDRSAWGKLGKALGDTIDAEAFDKLSGTESLPFAAGDHKRVAVKAIDHRGHEVMRVRRLGASYV